MLTSGITIKLRETLKKTLSNIIGKKVALFGMPFHGNIGDSLIALGELHMIRDLRLKCVYKRQLLDGITEFPKLSKDITILFQGGGDFGDVWPLIHQDRLKIMEHYRDHRIIVLPQSIKYNDDITMRAECLELSCFPDLHICCRDKESYRIMKDMGLKNPYLLPDMAFYIDQKKLIKHIIRPKFKRLYLKRIDKEFSKNDFISDEDIVSDWPLIDNKFCAFRFNMRLNAITGMVYKRGYNNIGDTVQKFSNWINCEFMYDRIASCGVRFLSEYDDIIVTRLHAAILAVLIGKQVTLLDNSYHKNKRFYDSWLVDVKDVKFIG